ncbi:MAG TPA: hypothetical protein VGR47_04295 [Terracidiphilus sp.]|nr:hypothetical protein [Terracidiphilus sp.]
MPISPPSPTLTGVLRATLERIEHSGEIDPADPAFLELKRSITLAMADFEMAKSAKIDAEIEPPLLETT